LPCGKRGDHSRRVFTNHARQRKKTGCRRPSVTGNLRIFNLFAAPKRSKANAPALAQNV
jgi:hypothetical protein